MNKDKVIQALEEASDLYQIAILLLQRGYGDDARATIEKGRGIVAMAVELATPDVYVKAVRA